MKEITDIGEITIEDIRKLEELKPKHEKMSYMHQYSAMIKHGANLKLSELEDVLVFSMAVYAWMPTTLKHNNRGSKALTNALTKVKKSEKLDVSDYKTVSSYMNNSYVGTSKLFHFINPEKYPIWDSLIARRFGITGSNECNKYDYYSAYMERVNDFIKRDKEKSKSASQIEKIKTHLENIQKITPTDVRAVEFYLWATEKEKYDTEKAERKKKRQEDKLKGNA